MVYKPILPGHVSLNGKEYVLQEETYSQQLQIPFNPRFSSGDPQFGDLSFFQYLAMEDWSGGDGQDTFVETNRFADSEGIDITKPGELKLAPSVIRVASVNGPSAEHLNRPIEDEEGWPQIINWLGRCVVYNDKIEYDGGGTEFLEVYETDVLQDQVVSQDPSGTAGNITNASRAEIISISKPYGLPGETFTVRVRFKRPELEFISSEAAFVYPGYPLLHQEFTQDVEFRLDFGGDSYRTSDSFVKQNISYARQTGQFEQVLGAGTNGSSEDYNESSGGRTLPAYYSTKLNRDIIVDFTMRIPNKPPGIYKLWTSCAISGAPFQTGLSAGSRITFPYPTGSGNPISRAINEVDASTNSNVLFFIQSVDQVVVRRRNLYAPMLKAATVDGNKLVGVRTAGPRPVTAANNKTYVEVYQRQNNAVDRTLQLSLATAGLTDNPTYAHLIAGLGVVYAAFDNKIYKIDIATSGLSVAQRFTSIGTVPGNYVSGMAIWNQKVYIASFDKSLFRSTISWTDGTQIQGSYDIDGRFWVTDLANFNNALFYSGGNQTGEGEVRAFPSVPIISVKHPVHDSRIRCLKAGRILYAGWSHGTGLLAINERGSSTWARINAGNEIRNVVWDIEEVGFNVFFLANGGFFKTTERAISSGAMETSEFGSHTPLVKKIWNAVRVECKKLDSPHKVRVLVTNSERKDGQWIVLGEMISSGGLIQEFLFPSNFETSNWMKIRLELITANDSSSPIVKKLLVKYVPEALQRWQWSIGIRCDDNLKLFDGNLDKRSGLEIVNDIKALKSSGTIRFRDIDGQNYNVVLTDMRFNPPLIDENRLETIALLELLET